MLTKTPKVRVFNCHLELLLGASSEKQICHPVSVTLKSEDHENSSPAFNEDGTRSDDSTSTPRIIKWSQHVSRLKSAPTARFAFRSIVMVHASLLSCAFG